MIVRLVSTARTGYQYFTMKNPRTKQHKLKYIKYDPIVNRHVIFEERKFKRN